MLRRRVSVAVLLLLAGLISTYSITAQSAIYVQDAFSRTVTDGWGKAPTGGSYKLNGTAANFDVSGSTGTIIVPKSGNSRTALLTSVLARDVDFSFRVHTNKLASGGGQYVYAIARRVNSNTLYQGYLRVDAARKVYAGATRLVGGTATALSNEVVVPNLTHQTNTFLRMRIHLSGTNPTRIAIKIWPDGSARASSPKVSPTLRISIA